MNSRVQLQIVKPAAAVIPPVEPERANVEAAARIACARLHSSLLTGSRPPMHTLPGLARCDFALAASLTAVTGAGRMTMPPQWYAALISSGSITAADIAAALRESLSSHVEWLTVEDILQHARHAGTATTTLPTIADLAQLPGIDNAASHVEEQIARWVCSWSLQMPGSSQTVPLYTAWHAAHRLGDDSGLSGFAAVVDRLPADALGLLHSAVDQLGLHVPGLANWFHRELMTIEYVAACVPAAFPPGRHEDDAASLIELLAIRVAWDLCLFRLLRRQGGLESAWSQARNVLRDGGHEDRQIALDCVLQVAYEKGWQRRFLQRLQRSTTEQPRPRPALAACAPPREIDAVDRASAADAVSTAFIAAPRTLTGAIDGTDKVQLHCYDWQVDSDASELTSIMTTTLVCAALQCMQDYRMTVSAAGSHQTTQQGPLRLSAVLAAPMASIDDIIARHPPLRTLINNRWLHLFAWSACGREILQRSPAGGWTPVGQHPPALLH